MENRKLNNDRLAEIKEQLEVKVSEYIVAIKDSNLNAMNNIDGEMKQLEQEYMELASENIYRECLSDENPIQKAILTYSYEVLTHKDEKEKGVLVGRKLEVRDRQIDLLKMCKYAKEHKIRDIDTSWQYDVMKLNALLTFRQAVELGLTKDQQKLVQETYYMHDIARQLDMGKTPTSNTQICKMLQQVVDKILFIPNEKGENSIKMLNKHVTYLLDVQTQKDNKVKLGIKIAKDDFMRRIIQDVIYAELTDSAFTLSFKVKKQ